jgi:predicted kinase
LKYLVTNAALGRLQWILDCMDGDEVLDEGIIDAIAPEYSEIFSTAKISTMIRRLSSEYAPVTVVGFDVENYAAKARIQNREGTIAVLNCTVEPESPHRITGISSMDLVRTDLPPRLPMDFTDYPLEANGNGGRLIVFSGLPGAGKSTLAEGVARELRIPAFSADWLLGSLTPFGGYRVERRQEMGAELLTTLALRQLIFGQSAILDSPSEDPRMRHRWRTLARKTGSDFKVIVCACPDRQVHRMRLDNRRRGIPGWHDGGNWPSVERRISEFIPWENDALFINTMDSHVSNVVRVLDYLR